MPDVPLAQQIACVARELRIRESVYPKWVKAGRMKLDDTEREIAAMKAVLETLERLRDAG